MVPGIFDREDILAWYMLDLHKNNQSIDVAVFENPRRSTLVRFTNEHNGGYFRGFLKPDGNIVLFDAYRATHADMGAYLGAEGAMRFEVRSPNGAQPGSPEMSSQLYIPKAYAEDKQQLREQPMIVRMFGNDTFHIGFMR